MSSATIHPLAHEFPSAHEIPRSARGAASPMRARSALPVPGDLSFDILKEIDVAVVVVSEDDHVTYANDWARQTIGGNIVTSSFAELWAEDADAVHDMLTAIAAATDWRSFSLTRKANGDNRTLNLRGRPMAVNRPPVASARHILITSDMPGQKAEPLVVEKPDRLAAAEMDPQRELVHRVKNNLALLMSLVRNARRNVQDQGADEEISGFERRLMSIAAMHDVLDARRETSSLRADDLLRRVCEGLGEALAPPNVRIDCRLDEVSVPVAIGSPLALIANELITNALKHGFPADRQGTVEVSLVRGADGWCEMAVRDDGIGAEAASTTSRRGSHGSGGTIIKALVMQLGGTLHSRDAASGTDWVLRFVA